MKLPIEDILFEEDIRVYNSPDKFTKQLSTEDVLLSKVSPIVIKYDYIDIGKTAYNFSQEFTHRDTVAYFKKMKEISSSTINDLVGRKDLHFYKNDIKGNLKNLIKEVMPDAIKTEPIVYHFALYTDEEMADRNSDIRSPRIYFMLGAYGFIYILFFDPYHEINP